MTIELDPKEPGGGQPPGRPAEPPGRRYTMDDVVSQSLVAFGQGTHFMRVSSRACRVLVQVMTDLCESEDVLSTWETDAVQLLERLRAIGRVSASLAVEEGRTAIEEADVRTAVPKVQLVSKSTWCDEPKAFP